MSDAYHQATAIFEPEPRPEYARQHVQLRANPAAQPPRAPESSRRSPLPSEPRARGHPRSRVLRAAAADLLEIGGPKPPRVRLTTYSCLSSTEPWLPGHATTYTERLSRGVGADRAS